MKFKIGNITIYDSAWLYLITITLLVLRVYNIVGGAGWLYLIGIMIDWVVRIILAIKFIYLIKKG